MSLSWRVQNIVVIGLVYFTLECFEFSSNFEFDRYMLSGTGASPVQPDVMVHLRFKVSVSNVTPVFLYFATFICLNEIAWLTNRNAIGDSDRKYSFKKCNPKRWFCFGHGICIKKRCGLITSRTVQYLKALIQEHKKRQIKRLKDHSEYHKWQTQFLLLLDVYNRTRKCGHYMQNG